MLHCFLVIFLVLNNKNGNKIHSPLCIIADKGDIGVTRFTHDDLLVCTLIFFALHAFPFSIGLFVSAIVVRSPKAASFVAAGVLSIESRSNTSLFYFFNKQHVYVFESAFSLIKTNRVDTITHTMGKRMKNKVWKFKTMNRFILLVWMTVFGVRVW